MEYKNLEIVIHFNDNETKPRTETIPVKNIKTAKAVVKAYENDLNFKDAKLYDVTRVLVSLD